MMAAPSIDQQSTAMGLSSAATFGIGAFAISSLGSTINTYLGWTNLLSIPLIQLCVPDECIGFATGLRTLMSLTGGSVATSIFSTIYARKATDFVPVEVSAAALANGLPETSLLDLLGSITGSTPDVPLSSVAGINPEIIAATTRAYRRANLHAFRYFWYASIPFGVIALLAALFTKDLYPVMTLKIAQHLKTNKSRVEHGVEGEFGSEKAVQAQVSSL
jgi:hypothetical protein